MMYTRGMSTYCISCVVILNLLGYGYCQQLVGDYCTDSNTRLAGECKVITNCPSAIANRKQGISLHICGFEGIEAIVCCVEAVFNTKPTLSSNMLNPMVPPSTTKYPPIHALTISTSVSSGNEQRAKFLRVGDKSRAKCKEYVGYAYTRAIAGVPPVRDCADQSVPLIVGGDSIVKEKEFPHLARIGFDGEEGEKAWLCSGSLISEQFVLTAAHCLRHREYGDVKYIHLGEMKLWSQMEDVALQDFNVEEVFKHPGYKPPSRYNDIAILKMDKKAKLNTYVRPACLETNPNLYITRKAIVSGWGHSVWSADEKDDIQKFIVQYVTNSECNERYKTTIVRGLKDGIVDHTQICAGLREETKELCQEDSGGPLQVVDKEEYCMNTIVGVTSFGKTCGVVNTPGVYTRVSSYINWIEDIVWP